MLVVILLIPVAFTIWNIVAFIMAMIKKKDGLVSRLIEILAMLTGFLYLDIYLDLKMVRYHDWDVALKNLEMHTMIATEYVPTIACFIGVAFVGYFMLRYISCDKQSPIVSALGMAAMYLGIIVLIVFMVQTSSDWIISIVPANCIIIFLKTIALTVFGKNELIQEQKVSLKYEKLEGILNDATNLYWIAFVLLIPLTGILVIILFLFGQEPNSMIKAWTETADWKLSMREAVPNVAEDEHYLCTVAAGGHKEVVKPLRTGKRHGHTVIVNRQLCIANAFEQILEEKTPGFHRVVRGIYDRTGYPIAKHIKTKSIADVIYFIMKPLEWIFLLVIYTVDVNPEDRIAVQYPHRELHEVK